MNNLGSFFVQKLNREKLNNTEYKYNFNLLLFYTEDFAAKI